MAWRFATASIPVQRLVAGIDTDGDGTSDNEEFRLGSNPVTRDCPFQEKGAYQFALKSELQATTASATTSR